MPHRFRPSPAMVVACLALVIALSSGAYAALKLPKNSVGSAQLKKNAVTGVKIKKNSIDSSKVKDGSLLVADFKRGQLPTGPVNKTSGIVGITASGGSGTTVPLLTVGPITYTATCTDTGSGNFKTEINLASSEAGTFLASTTGGADLFATPRVAFNTGPVAMSISYSFRIQVITPTTSHRADVMFAVRKLGKDCVARVDTTSP